MIGNSQREESQMNMRNEKVNLTIEMVEIVKC